MSTSTASDTALTCRWTGACRQASAAPCCTACPRSATDTPPATPPWHGWPATPGPSERWERHVRPTRCPLSCHATASCALTAAWVATSAESRPSAPCSPWRQQHDRRPHQEDQDDREGRSRRSVRSEEHTSEL